MENDIPVVDFTDAKELGPMPEGLYRLAIGKWKYGRTGNGAKVDIEFSVIEPDGINQKVFESTSLENEYTKARVMNLMAAAGFASKEEIAESQNFSMPSEDDMIGRTLGARIKTQAGKDGYNDKSVIAKAMSDDEYEEAVEAETSGI